MTSANFSGRNELLQWINSTLGLHLTKIEQVSVLLTRAAAPAPRPHSFYGFVPPRSPHAVPLRRNPAARAIMLRARRPRMALWHVSWWTPSTLERSRCIRRADAHPVISLLRHLRRCLCASCGMQLSMAWHVIAGGLETHVGCTASPPCGVEASFKLASLQLSPAAMGPRPGGLRWTSTPTKSTR